MNDVIKKWFNAIPQTKYNGWLPVSIGITWLPVSIGITLATRIDRDHLAYL